MAGGLLGGLKEVFSNGEAEKYAKYAVQEHNAKNNGRLSFIRVISAKQQVVQGTLYHLTLEADTGSNKERFDAKVWVKPWENHQSLESFGPSQS